LHPRIWREAIPASWAERTRHTPTASIVKKPD